MAALQIRLGDSLKHAGGLTFDSIGITTTVRNYRLENVVLDSDSLVLFKAGKAIPETAYFDPPNSASWLPVDCELTAIACNDRDPSPFRVGISFRADDHAGLGGDDD